MDFLLDQTTWDTPIIAGELATVTDVIQEVIQRVAIAYKTHLGEWLYDINRGLPWVEEILVKNPDLDAIKSRITDYTLTIEGVTAVVDIGVALNENTRVMTITANLETEDGITGPFLVDVP